MYVVALKVIKMLVGRDMTGLSMDAHEAFNTRNSIDLPGCVCAGDLESIVIEEKRLRGHLGDVDLFFERASLQTRVDKI